MQDEPKKLTWTVRQAQEATQLSRVTILKLIWDGEIQARRIGKRRWLILRDSLEGWLRAGNEG